MLTTVLKKFFEFTLPAVRMYVRTKEVKGEEGLHTDHSHVRWHADALAIVEQPQHEEQPPVTPPRLELAHLEEDHDDSVSEADTDTLLCDWEALRSELESLALASVENRSANMLPQALK